MGEEGRLPRKEKTTSLSNSGIGDLLKKGG